jgi:biopolymer transport protein ExbD
VEIDLAPMLDFVLNLLIFFIITTSFVKEAGITVDQPEAITVSAHENANILIAIRSNGDVWMDKKQVDLREVRPLIERLHVERPDDKVIVIGDKAAPAGMLAAVMDEVKLGGVKDVYVGATNPAGG